MENQAICDEYVLFNLAQARVTCEERPAEEKNSIW